VPGGRGARPSQRRPHLPRGGGPHAPVPDHAPGRGDRPAGAAGGGGPPGGGPRRRHHGPGRGGAPTPTASCTATSSRPTCCWRASAPF
jgi:hypothetical protein